jgi:hypothetical protein
MISQKDILKNIPHLDEKCFSLGNELHQKISQLFPSLPQEGLRCKSYISLDLGSILLQKNPIPRITFAKASIVPSKVYNKYLELFLNAIESDGRIIVDSNYILKILGFQEFENTFELIFNHLNFFSENRQDQRRRLAVSSFFFYELFGKPISFEDCCSYCCCQSESNINIKMLKTIKGKYKDFFINLRKSTCDLSLSKNLHEKLTSSKITVNMNNAMEFCGFIELK